MESAYRGTRVAYPCNNIGMLYGVRTAWCLKVKTLSIRYSLQVMCAYSIEAEAVRLHFCLLLYVQLLKFYNYDKARNRNAEETRQRR